MATAPDIKFYELVEIVDALPEEQQDNLFDIIRRRRIERRRDEIEKNIEEGRAEFERGECRGGSIDDLMRELDD